MPLSSAEKSAEQFQYSARLRSANSREIKRFGPLHCAHMQRQSAEMYRNARACLGLAMITLTTDYKRDSLTEQFPTLEEAETAYSDADWAACHQPGNDIRRITLRIDGTTVKTRAY